jgi:hypothetical protein
MEWRMTIVLTKEKEKIGTHVLVIGVGRYPFLLNGEGPPEKQFEYHGGMGQLTSPPRSALEIAQWFATKHKHPDDKPIRTLELLISGTPNTFMTSAGQMIAEPATMENIRKAIKRWRDYGNFQEQNLLIFYFCGHGVSTGNEQLLLAEDFGSDKDDPFRHAVNFSGLHIGMRDCKAKWQCYFLDACQTVSQTYLDQFGYEAQGESIIVRPVSSNLRNTEQPVLLACALGAKAYGEEGKASFFTQALLSAFKGAAAKDNGYGEWEINTAQLRGGLNAFLERMVERGYGKEQVARDDKLAKPFSLHALDGKPLIPVDVACGDRDRTEEISFECIHSGSVVRLSPVGGKLRIWEIELPPGEYDFRARHRSGEPPPPSRDGVTVHPPHQLVLFKCP